MAATQRPGRSVERGAVTPRQKKKTKKKTELEREQVGLRFEKEILKEIDDYAARLGRVSRQNAIRILLRRALDAL